MTFNITVDNNCVYEYLTQRERPKGIIHISHGMAEHINRYNWLITKLNSDGFHVISADHKGHGIGINNGDMPGYFANQNGWELVTRNLRKLILSTNDKYPKLNQFLIGHSMGSWIALSAIQKPLPIKGLILTGSSKIPNFLIRIQRLLIAIEIFRQGKMGTSDLLNLITIRSFNNNFKPNRTNSDWISSDNSNVDEYIKDPLCGFRVTNSLWEDQSIGMLSVFNRRGYKDSNTNVPILLLSGSLDPVGRNGKGVRSLFTYLKGIFPDIKYELVENARHEVFSEKNKELSYGILKTFITKY